MLETKKIEKLYNDFWLNLEIFLNLFILANSMQPSGIKWKEEFIKKVIVDKPIKTLREINKKLTLVL